MKTSQNDVVRARINKEIKLEAEAVLSSIGLTVSDAFRMMMLRIAKEKTLPFSPFVPDEETLEAMRISKRRDLRDAGYLATLLARLNAVENAVAQQRLEGLVVEPDIIDEMKRAALGEINLEEGIQNTIRRYKHG